MVESSYVTQGITASSQTLLRQAQKNSKLSESWLTEVPKWPIGSENRSAGKHFDVRKYSGGNHGGLWLVNEQVGALSDRGDVGCLVATKKQSGYALGKGNCSSTQRELDWLTVVCEARKKGAATSVEVQHPRVQHLQFGTRP